MARPSNDFPRSPIAPASKARPITLVLKGRNKNDRRAAIQSLETVLQLDAVHSEHLNVTDQT
jgi:hypothetical protein